MRRLLLGLVMLVIAVRPAAAQWTVHDPANTARNTLTALYEQHLVEAERIQHAKLRDMARRLSAVSDLRRYMLLDVPRWRTHGGDSYLYAKGINDALIFGDPPGAAYLAISHPVLSARGLMGTLSHAAQRSLASRLAT